MTDVILCQQIVEELPPMKDRKKNVKYKYGERYVKCFFYKSNKNNKCNLADVCVCFRSIERNAYYDIMLNKQTCVSVCVSISRCNVYMINLNYIMVSGIIS